MDNEKDEGWTRVAYLNMSDTNQSCPTGFRLYQSGGVRACGRQASSGASCQSIKFQAGISYSQVRGRVVGYQYRSPDAINNYKWPLKIDPNHDNINSYYVFISYPLIGLLADIKLTRYQMICLSCWISFVSYAIVSILSILVSTDTIIAYANNTLIAGVILILV